ncbi:urease accessory protein UreD [Gorillibacterium sp. sgz500922]|uniref:urease accessory protein UreD n=1 Tax=Gorillibacterium sp. sgz500922 TaxID=3446694 RepID=UPI003F66B900
MRERDHAYPLKIAKAFPGWGGALGWAESDSGTARLRRAGLSLCLMDASPGLMEGDRNELDWRAESGAMAFVTGQSYTKVHPFRAQGCRMNQRLRVEAGALLEYRPPPLMLFAEAELRSSTVAEVAPGGALLMTELLCPGRLHRGERFAFRRLDSRLEVRSGGETAYANRLLLEPGREGGFSGGKGGWDGFSHLGSLYAFGDGLGRAERERLEEELRKSAAFSDPSRILWGIGLTCRSGLVLTALSASAAVAEALLDEAATIVRRRLVRTIRIADPWGNGS